MNEKKEQFEKIKVTIIYKVIRSAYKHVNFARFKSQF